MPSSFLLITAQMARPAVSGRAALVHPGPASAPAGILPRRHWAPAAPAALAGRAGRGTVQPPGGGVLPAGPGRAGGARGKAQPPGAEVLQVRLTHLLVDPHGSSHRLSAGGGSNVPAPWAPAGPSPEGVPPVGSWVAS